jgi:hypothetical protein
LIYIKGSQFSDKDLTILNNYFINGKQAMIAQKKTEIIKTVWSKRVMDEIRELYKRDCIMGDDGVKFTVTNTDSMNIITLNIFRETFAGSELFNDMTQMDINFIKLEIRLPTNYPFEPPFIRIAIFTGFVSILEAVVISSIRWLISFITLSGLFNLFDDVA